MAVQKNGTVVPKSADDNSNILVQIRTYKASKKNGTLIGRTGKLCYIIAPDYENCDP